MFLKCIKSVVMDDEPEYVAFVEGRIYKFSYQGNMLRSINENGHPHYFDGFHYAVNNCTLHHWINWFEEFD